MSDTYQVVAECAHVTVNGPSGRAVNLLLKGALVPADAPELERLIDIGYVAKVGGEEKGGVDASGIPAGAYDTDVPAAITSTPVQKTGAQLEAEREAADKEKADAEIANRRAAAKAKLPSDGSAPDGRAAQPVWVEYLASKGYDYAELTKQDRTELQKLAAQKS
jgi:hypothetical protein